MTFRDTVANALLPVILANPGDYPEEVVRAVKDYETFWRPLYSRDGHCGTGLWRDYLEALEKFGVVNFDRESAKTESTNANF